MQIVQLSIPDQTPQLKRRRTNRGCTTKPPQASFCEIPVDCIRITCRFLGPHWTAKTIDIASSQTRSTVDQSLVWQQWTLTDFHVFSIPHLKRTDKSLDWRASYSATCLLLMSFRHPFRTKHLLGTDITGDVAYLNAVIQTRKLRSLASGEGIYIEITVGYVSDNLSLSLVDFDGGGTSSLTFSPDCGALIQETKSFTDNLVHGEYAAALGSCREFGRLNESRMAIYISRDLEINFMRYCAGNWESTGFLRSCGWAVGGLLTPCVAFRNPGEYKVRISNICVRRRPQHATKHTEALVWKPIAWVLDNGRDAAETMFDEQDE